MSENADQKMLDRVWLLVELDIDNDTILEKQSLLRD
jgi:hypothetical protein